ncbi:hypothetical protein FQR65_LT02074 [Abscondita terminalis]|nr:hypothetical protein FQR65_LT02074 [Abscondita terminalis]
MSPWWKDVHKKGGKRNDKLWELANIPLETKDELEFNADFGNEDNVNPIVVVDNCSESSSDKDSDSEDTSPITHPTWAEENIKRAIKVIQDKKNDKESGRNEENPIQNVTRWTDDQISNSESEAGSEINFHRSRRNGIYS